MRGFENERVRVLFGGPNHNPNSLFYSNNWENLAKCWKVRKNTRDSSVLVEMWWENAKKSGMTNF